MIEVHIVVICALGLFLFLVGCVLGFIAGVEQPKKLNDLTYQSQCDLFKRKD